MILLILAARRSPSPEKVVWIKRFVGFGCLAAWVINALYWLMPEQIGWHQSLPIHFCYMADLIGAAAVFSGGRLFKSVLYFWATTLCIWAFLTPLVDGGVRDFSFWLFWVYHLFILLAVTEVLFVQGFRPRFGDLKAAILFTAGYTGILAVLDFFFEWNYGFVGPRKPGVPTLLDMLGPYPVRLIWLGMLGLLLFFLAWLPWAIFAKEDAVLPVEEEQEQD